MESHETFGEAAQNEITVSKKRSLVPAVALLMIALFAVAIFYFASYQSDSRPQERVRVTETQAFSSDGVVDVTLEPDIRKDLIFVTNAWVNNLEVLTASTPQDIEQDLQEMMQVRESVDVSALVMDTSRVYQIYLDPRNAQFSEVDMSARLRDPNFTATAELVESVLADIESISLRLQLELDEASFSNYLESAELQLFNTYTEPDNPSRTMAKVTTYAALLHALQMGESQTSPYFERTGAHSQYDRLIVQYAASLRVGLINSELAIRNGQLLAYQYLDAAEQNPDFVRLFARAQTEWVQGAAAEAGQ